MKNQLRKLLIRVCVCLMTTLVCLAPALAHPKSASRSVVSEGVGVILGWNHKRARAQALKEALRRSLALTIKEYLFRKDYIANYLSIRKNIYPYYKRYIQTYKLIDEHQEGALYRISIRSQIDVATLMKHLIGLQIISQRADRPAVAIGLVSLSDNLSPDQHFQLFSETNVPSKDDDLEKETSGKWNRFLPPMENLFPNLLRDTILERLISWGAIQVNSSEADILLEVQGKGSAQGHADGKRLFYQAVIDLTAVPGTPENQSAYKVSTSAVAYHQELQLCRKYAFNQAAREAGEMMVEHLSQYYDTILFEKNCIELVITEVNDRQLVLLKEGLHRSVKEIDNQHITTHYFSHGVAKIKLKIKESPYRLAEALKRKNFPGFNLILEEYNQERLNFRYVAKGNLPPDQRDGVLLGVEESSS